MINKVTITNHLGESVALELRFPEKSGFLIGPGGIDGLGPAKATINITEMAVSDGSMFNSSRVNSRNIVFSLSFMITPQELTIEKVRLKSYKYFPIKRRIRIQVETDTDIYDTYGYVESNEPNIFSKEEGSIISVICPDAYFYSDEINVTVFAGVEPEFEFPFSNESLTEKVIRFGSMELNSEKTVFYTGNASIGVVIFIHALGPATNIRIYNTRTQEHMYINTDRLLALTGVVGILEGDDIVISTIKGDKFIVLQRNGVIINILNTLETGRSWFQLESGDNLFVFAADDGAENLQFRVENQIAYEGV